MPPHLAIKVQRIVVPRDGDVKQLPRSRGPDSGGACPRSSLCHETGLSPRPLLTGAHADNAHVGHGVSQCNTTDSRKPIVNSVGWARDERSRVEWPERQRLRAGRVGRFEGLRATDTEKGVEEAVSEGRFRIGALPTAQGCAVEPRGWLARRMVCQVSEGARSSGGARPVLSR